MKHNSHIFLILIFIVSAFVLAFYLGRNIKQSEAKERQELVSDTARTNRAYRTYERVHRQQLMEDPDYAALVEENEELRARLQRIAESANDLEDALYYFERKGFDVSEYQDHIDAILSECQ